MSYHVVFHVQPVRDDDEDHDYNECILASSLARQENGEDESMERNFDLRFNLDETIAALHELSEDDLLADMIRVDHPTGYCILQAAISPMGVTLDTLAAFATRELRMRTIELFMRENFLRCALCSRTDSMARYKICDTNIRAHRIYELIEMHLHDLMLMEYEVIQTSGEQVCDVRVAKE